MTLMGVRLCHDRRCSNDEGAEPSGHGNRGRRSERTRRLKIRSAVGTIPGSAGEIAARSVANVEFELVRTGCDWTDSDREGAIAVTVGQDYADLNFRHGCSYTLGCQRETGAAAQVCRKLAEGCRKCGAEEVKGSLIKFARCRAHQGIGQR